MDTLRARAGPAASPARRGNAIARLQTHKPDGASRLGAPLAARLRNGTGRPVRAPRRQVSRPARAAGCSCRERRKSSGGSTSIRSWRATRSCIETWNAGFPGSDTYRDFVSWRRSSCRFSATSRLSGVRSTPSSTCGATCRTMRPPASGGPRLRPRGCFCRGLRSSRRRSTSRSSAARPRSASLRSILGLIDSETLCRRGHSRGESSARSSMGRWVEGPVESELS